MRITRLSPFVFVFIFVFIFISLSVSLESDALSPNAAAATSRSYGSGLAGGLCATDKSEMRRSPGFR